LVALLILALAGLSGLPLTAAEENDPPKKAAEHASIAAYPGAVISVKDARTEMLFYVESNGRQLVAFDKDGAVAWSVDVMAQAKIKPERGAAVIRHLRVQDGELFVTCGKSHSYKVEPKTGKVQFIGND
jgi:outer membrane protein assembly factor BamB